MRYVSITPPVLKMKKLRSEDIWSPGWVLASPLGTLETHMVGCPGPEAEQQRGLCLHDPGLLLRVWAFWPGTKPEGSSGPPVPLLQGIRFSAGVLIAEETTQKPSAFIPKGGPTCSPLKQVTGSLLSALERDAVNMRFKPKLVPNQSDCQRQNDKKIKSSPCPSLNNVSLNILKFTKCKVMNDSKLLLCSGERYTQLLIEIMNQSIIQQANEQR